jgi:UDP-2,3-diacylglucosamine pyrophosphatase LpxH
MKTEYNTVVLSDLHLGMDYSKSKQTLNFLKSIKFEKLILNGDIIDGWEIKRKMKIKKTDLELISYFLKIAKNTSVYWIKGNHDDFLNNFFPLKIGNLEIKDEMIYTSLKGRKYFVTHGDCFDVFVSKMKWLAMIGSIGYDIALWINEKYNLWRKFRGKKYFSLSKKIKDSVKIVTKFLGDFEKFLTDEAKERNCYGVICGHIHQADDKMVNGIHYLNSGDWVESLSCLVEDKEGNWKIVYYEK